MDVSAMMDQGGKWQIVKWWFEEGQQAGLPHVEGWERPLWGEDTGAEDQGEPSCSEPTAGGPLPLEHVGQWDETGWGGQWGPVSLSLHREAPGFHSRSDAQSWKILGQGATGSDWHLKWCCWLWLGRAGQLQAGKEESVGQRMLQMTVAWFRRRRWNWWEEGNHIHLGAGGRQGSSDGGQWGEEQG